MVKVIGELRTSMQIILVMLLISSVDLPEKLEARCQIAQSQVLRAPTLTLLTFHWV
jgi:hypothetical protein